MIRKFLAIAAVATAALALPQAASAKTNVYIGIGAGCIGNPYACGYEPGYDAYDDYDSYDAPDYYDYRPRRHYQPVFDDGLNIPDRMTCKGARWMLEERGWRNVRVRECRGTSYTFTASRRGVVSVLRVNPLSGRITSIRRID